MSLRTTRQKLIRRDPATALRERATELRGSLSRRTVVAGTVATAVPLPALAAQPQSERAEYRACLLAAYAEDRARRPSSKTAEFSSVEERAADLVGRRLWHTAREVLALPPPTTSDGLALTALAAAIMAEAEYTNDEPAITAAVSLTRAVLHLHRGSLPRGVRWVRRRARPHRPRRGSLQLRRLASGMGHHPGAS
ncbi:hypothetical protein MKK84_27755 [Methylobacterium sp. E-065]|uniref:hypothetical protein n=1 Tax=Methylobacterium sp. E-065 TaxID=2836583 RepID=UPI001FBBCDC2|nr:hypothetical protein [Methylobacterium sp. E-065]MCJ2021170.1 hypothetical protein [Methylobacterium sp. E-065]